MGVLTIESPAMYRAYLSCQYGESVARRYWEVHKKGGVADSAPPPRTGAPHKDVHRLILLALEALGEGDVNNLHEWVAPRCTSKSKASIQEAVRFGVSCGWLNRRRDAGNKGICIYWLSELGKKYAEKIDISKISVKPSAIRIAKIPGQPDCVPCSQIQRAILAALSENPGTSSAQIRSALVQAGHNPKDVDKNCTSALWQMRGFNTIERHKNGEVQYRYWLTPLGQTALSWIQAQSRDEALAG